MTAELVWLGSLFAATVIIAALVNGFARAHRKRLRRVVFLFGLYAIVQGAAWALVEVDATWSARLAGAAELARVICVLNLATMLLFVLLLPAVAISLPMIAGDLIAGMSYLIATIVTLSRHGMDPRSVVATGAVVSAVLAISLQTTLGNILGGVAIQVDGSIHEGDYIKLGDVVGRVRSIRWRHTLVETTDASTIVVPNQQLLQNNITILGWRDGDVTPQRVWVRFNVDVHYLPLRVMKVVADAIAVAGIEHIAPTPTPDCVCLDLEQKNLVSYAARYWLTDPTAPELVASRVRARIHAALRREGIPLAEVVDPDTVEHRAKTEAEHNLVALRSVHLFAGLTPDEMVLLAQGMRLVPFTAGETIAHQGSIATSLYVLTSGQVEVRTKVDLDGTGPAPAHTGLVATITAPDFFGEMGLMTGEPRRADVIAKTDVECFRIGKETFERVLLKRPDIANELSELLAARNVALQAARDDLDEAARATIHATERDRIRDGIRSFFGLS